jgi:hypothetical protein
MKNIWFKEENVSHKPFSLLNYGENFVPIYYGKKERSWTSFLE